MGRPSPAYAPKAPAQGVLSQVVRDRFETFWAEAARLYERDALPRFIEEEFRGEAFYRLGAAGGGGPGALRIARQGCADRKVPPTPPQDVGVISTKGIPHYGYVPSGGLAVNVKNNSYRPERVRSLSQNSIASARYSSSASLATSFRIRSS